MTERDTAWEADMEYSRSRSRSVVGESMEHCNNENELTDIQTLRHRSQSFTSVKDRPLNESLSSGEIAKHAAALSKIYLLGSTPVDVSKLNDGKSNGGRKVEILQRTGALSAQALDALSEGLQLSLDMKKIQSTQTQNAHYQLEEEMEEKQMEEEEEMKRKTEKTLNKSITTGALFFKSKMTKAKSKLSIQTPSFDVSHSNTSRCASMPSHGLSRKHKLKLLLLGDSGVGKTSLMRVFSGDMFSDSMLATAGVDFKLGQISVGEEKIVLQIWDTAGQERFHRIVSTYYKGANGIVLVYDVTDKRGFDNVEYWMSNIRQYSSQLPAMLLVGNKIDLENRSVSCAEGERTANQYNCRFIETSAKTSKNTNDALETIARDAFLLQLDPEITQKILIDKEKAGRRKDNCVVS
uniref:Rab8 family GTPase putative n=1 Tax=Albugo laibachii Nc14 TaxID=890382 RepID=F0WX25_9STRA|nr:Rab8 family GTPase putative [Albugo laibachii Nc14]|eukprot:CCA26014.1 Rab8 family GTPase putative [Albugo laibachii Nc14]